MGTKKPLFKKSGSPVDSSDYSPQLAFAGVPEIVEIKEQSWFSIIGSWFKGVILFLLLAVAVLVVVYGSLAATVMFITPVNGTNTLVARGTYVGGIPENGSKVLVSSSENAPDEFVGKIKVGFLGVPDAAVLKVESKTQYDKVTVVNGKVTVAGKAVKGTLLDPKTGKAMTNDSFRLDNQYVTSCSAGACKEGTLVIVGPKRLFGEVKPFEVGL